ncbi:MAG: hypothetical protein FJ096_21700 [Deltaproteobacteria bacterium]|nr:hypothetical protein [Deltaproteobacteria bacterium]
MRRLTILVLGLLGCNAAPRAPEGTAQKTPSAPRAATAATTTVTTSRAETTSVTASSERTTPNPPATLELRAFERCGELECLRFDSSSEALRHVLTLTRPRVLAIGESHAPKGSEAIESTASRVRREWLAHLRGLASDVVMELPVPPKGCEPARREVIEKVERPVTQTQRGDNRNEFLELANASRAAGIQPWALEPTCDELKSVGQAGDESLAAMMSLIAELTFRRLQVLDARRPPDALLVAYGGALHNDVAPAPDRLGWSFGSRLVAALGNRYVELDAFVPEHVRDTESWRRMPWYRHHDPAAAPDKVTLMRVGPTSFVLLFARTSPAP